MFAGCGVLCVVVCLSCVWCLLFVAYGSLIVVVVRCLLLCDVRLLCVLVVCCLLFAVCVAVCC